MKLLYNNNILYEYQISNFCCKFKSLENCFEFGHFDLLFDWLSYETAHLQAFPQSEENSGETHWRAHYHWPGTYWVFQLSRLFISELIWLNNIEITLFKTLLQTIFLWLTALTATPAQWAQNRKVPGLQSIQMQ